jgi:hypothetical protein
MAWPIQAVRAQGGGDSGANRPEPSRAETDTVARCRDTVPYCVEKPALCSGTVTINEHSDSENFGLVSLRPLRSFQVVDFRPTFCDRMNGSLASASMAPAGSFKLGPAELLTSDTS